jgi:hypothetical protein
MPITTTRPLDAQHHLHHPHKRRAHTGFQTTDGGGFDIKGLTRKAQDPFGVQLGLHRAEIDRAG